MKFASLTVSLLALISVTASSAGYDRTQAYITTTIVKPVQSTSGSDDLPGGMAVSITKKVIPAARANLSAVRDLGIGDTVPPAAHFPAVAVCRLMEVQGKPS